MAAYPRGPTSEVVLEPPAGSPEAGVAPDLLFVRVPGGQGRPRTACTSTCDRSTRPAEVARLEGLGARRVDVGQRDVSWVVMADPEGNEFCVLRALPTA